jgi:hypothetical protein
MLVTMTEGMMVRSCPLALADGDILLPAYHETGHDTEMVGPDSCSLFFRFDAQLHTWTETNRIRSQIGNIQPAVASITDDYLVCYCRRGGDYSGRPDGRIVRAESRDGGRTWSQGERTEFRNPNAASEFLRLKSGNLLLIFNDSTENRTPLTAALSTDGDKTYSYRLNLIEGPGDYAYPYAIQTDDGNIHLVARDKAQVRRAESSGPHRGRDAHLKQKLAALQNGGAGRGTEILNGHLAPTVRPGDDADRSMDDERGDRVGGGRGIAQIAAHAGAPLDRRAAHQRDGVNQTGEELMDRRLAAAAREMEAAPQYDLVVVNDRLPEALGTLRDFLNKKVFAGKIGGTAG